MCQTFTKNFDNFVVTGYGSQLPAILTTFSNNNFNKFYDQCSTFTLYSATLYTTNAT